MKSNQELKRTRVYNFYIENKEKGKKYTVSHFETENIPKSTTYNIIDHANSKLGPGRVHGSGRKAKIMTKMNIKKLKAIFDHKDCISQSKAARKFKCHQTFISKTLSRHTNIKIRKKQIIPKRTEEQTRKARERCGRLYRKFPGFTWILDDESYFTFSHSSIKGNNLFYTSNHKRTSPNVKYLKKSKFEPKLLVWMAISAKGFSVPYFIPSGLAINQYLYKEECLKKRLIPFIKQHHSNDQYVFWPDLASSHYAKSVVEYLRDQNVNFVEFKDNPPNVPEIRPIENFWSILKSYVYDGNWKAENYDQLRERIKYCMKKVDMSVVQGMISSIPSKLNTIRRHGVIEKK